MPSPSIALAKKISDRFKSLEATRSKVESLVQIGMLNRRDADRAYEGLFLSVNIAIEQFIEDLFIGLLVAEQGVQSSRPDVLPRIIVKSHKVAKEVVLGARRNYIDWLPYHNTIDLANVFFRGGRPFSDLTNTQYQSQYQTLQKCHCIRNALAHQSAHSLRKFEDFVIGATNVPTRERKPASYLRGYFRINPVQTRYENYVAQMAGIARLLAK